MDGEKDVAIISEAASSGISLQRWVVDSFLMCNSLVTDFSLLIIATEE